MKNNFSQDIHNLLLEASSVHTKSKFIRNLKLWREVQDLGLFEPIEEPHGSRWDSRYLKLTEYGEKCARELW
jgi:hypothetical protein